MRRVNVTGVPPTRHLSQEIGRVLMIPQLLHGALLGALLLLKAGDHLLGSLAALRVAHVLIVAGPSVSVIAADREEVAAR